MEAKSKSSSNGVSGIDLYKQGFSDSYRPIPTFVESLDEKLGGGIQLGMITELVGDKGVGKTTLCVQLCLNVQIPLFLQGLDSCALFIDTENTFVNARVEEMANAFVSHCNGLLASKGKNKMSTRRCLSRINVVKVKNINQLSQIISSLVKYISINRHIRLIVIDSIAFPFYAHGENFWERVKPLYEMGQTLHYIAGEFGVAVVLTNNLTTRFDQKDEKYFVPYLGDMWFNVPNQRINLYWDISPKVPRVRVADIIKSNCAARDKANYRVTTEGVRH